jgi:hypothetical protein
MYTRSIHVLNSMVIIYVIFEAIAVSKSSTMLVSSLVKKKSAKKILPMVHCVVPFIYLLYRDS